MGCSCGARDVLVGADSNEADPKRNAVKQGLGMEIVRKIELKMSVREPNLDASHLGWPIRQEYTIRNVFRSTQFETYSGSLPHVRQTHSDTI